MIIYCVLVLQHYFRECWCMEGCGGFVADCCCASISYCTASARIWSMVAPFASTEECERTNLKEGGSHIFVSLAYDPVKGNRSLSGHGKSFR